MIYCERQLTKEERELASVIREHVPRNDRLYVCQTIHDVISHTHEFAPDHFPRYRFFQAAIPDSNWEQYAEQKEG